MKQVLVSAVVSILVLGLAYAYLHKHPEFLGSASAVQESTYSRIIHSGEIHCGYSVWNPLLTVDANTGEKKGIFHDLMEEVGKRLELKIVWQEELGWGTVVEAVRSHRVDMSCAGYWLHPDRIKNVSATTSQLYAPLYIWVRQDEKRFNVPEDLNSEHYTVGMIDGGSSSKIISARFPRAKVFSLPEMATNSDQIEALASGKVDFVIDDATTFDAYMVNNPGKVRSLFPDHPAVVFPVAMLLPPDDPRLKEVIDNTLHNIEYDGTLDAILKTYHSEGDFLRNPQPIKMP